MKLTLTTLLLLLLSQISFAQFDFKLEHTYDSLTLARTQLHFSKKVRYVGFMERFDSIRQFYIDSPIYQIYDENHKLLKRVESTYPIIKNPNSTHDKSLLFIGESGNGKLLFYERISTYYPYPNRVIDEDGNEAIMDTIYNFTIDSTEEISPKAIKRIYENDGSLRVQYYSYPELKFEKEYYFGKFEKENYVQALYRKKFAKAGEKFVFVGKDSTVSLLNLDHSLWKKIKLNIPNKYTFDLSGLKYITQNSDSTFNFLYEVTRTISNDGCGNFNIIANYVKENGDILYEANYTILSGPPERRCSNVAFGALLSVNENKLIYHNYGTHGNSTPQTWYTKIMNITTLKVDTTFRDSSTSFPTFIQIDKRNFYIWTQTDSTKFYDEDFNYKFSTVPLNYPLLTSAKLVNNDSLIEWFSRGSNRISAFNQKGKELFDCKVCSDPILSVIKNEDDKLIFKKYGQNNLITTLIYSKNVISSTIDKSPILSNFKIYPNPFSNNLFVENLKEQNTPLSIQLISSSGQVLFSKKFTSKSIIIKDLEFIQNGLYFLRIQSSEKESEIFKIVKLK